MVVLLKIVQVVLALSVLVLIHELGHFLFAKMFGIRVEKFYLFFDIGGRALFKFKPKNSDTEYGIGWLPLGGYCKITGMVDESMDTEFMKTEPKPWEFRSHPAWQRLLVMAGGVLFNFVFAIILYIGIVAGWGTSYISNEDNQIYVNELAYDMGFRNGDRILKFDDYAPDNFGMLQADLVRQTASKAVVLRGKDTVDIYIDHSRIPDILNSPGMFDLAVPFVIDNVPEQSVNYGSGLAAGDRIVALAGEDIEFVQDSRNVLRNNAGGEIPAVILRGEDTLSMQLQVDTTGKIVVYPVVPGFKHRSYSFFEAIPAGFKMTFETIGGYIQDLKLIFNPSTEAYKSVGSFISMGQIFPSNWNWFQFINILALLSIMLGVMNLLPVPALDGGHIVFLIYEIITGRKPSDKFLSVMQLIGMFLLFALMILAFGNDLGRLFG